MRSINIPLQILWVLLTGLLLEVSSQPLTQYTCACPISVSTVISISTVTASASTSLSASASKSTSASISASTSSSVKTVSSSSSTSAKSSSLPISSSVSSVRSSSASASPSVVSTTSSKLSSAVLLASSSVKSTSSSSTSVSTTSSGTSKASTVSSTTSKSTAGSNTSSSKLTSASSTVSTSSTSKASSSITSPKASSITSSASSSKTTTTSSESTSLSSSSTSLSSSSKTSTSSTSTSQSAVTSTTSSHSTTKSSSTSTSTKTTSTSSSIPTTDSSGYHAFPTLSPNSAITASSYTRLTSLLPQALKNAISISTHSWELGTLANSLTEVYYPYLSPFNYDSSSLPTSSTRKRAVPDGWGNETHREIPTDSERIAKRSTQSPPWSVLDVVTKSLSSYSWSGAPSTYSWNTDTKLSDYLSSSTSPVGLPSTALVAGDGALGDPCALGAGAWIAAEYFQQSSVQTVYGNGRKGVDYAWAVGGQYSHLESGTRASNGTLSQREGYFETWADMGYMISPFVAYIGMATSSQTMLNDALSQWCLETSSMLNYNTMLFLHIPDWDQRPWATGNGWMLAGFTRVVASIYSAGQSGTFWSVIDPYESTVAGVFTAIFNQLTSENLVPNYLLNTGDSTGDSSGTAIITAAYYRFRTLAPWRVNSWMDSKASAMFDAVVNKVGSDGWLTQVVNPEWDNGWNVFSGQSPEGQSFLGLMWAARTAAGV